MKKNISAVLSLALIFCLLFGLLSGCGKGSSTPACDCKIGETFVLNGMSFQIIKAEFDPEHDDGELAGVKVSVLCCKEGEAQSFTDYNAATQTASCAIDMVLYSGKKEFVSEPRVGLLMNEDKTDDEFSMQINFFFAVAKDADITFAAVYANRGAENEEKVLVDFSSASLRYNQGGKLRIVTTIFPIYDWVRQIAGERLDDIELTMLLDSGVDLHSYQPTAKDLMRVSSCDLFVFVGGESDSWTDDALANTQNPDQITVNLMQSLGDTVKEEEVVDGMQAEEEEGEEGEEEEIEYDEHVWLSLRSAQTLCGVLAEKMGEADPDNAALYKTNADAYIEKLGALDAQYTQAVNGARVKTLLVADRFPFRYMADDYGLTYYAAFVGCSAETEASFQTISFLAKKVDELGLHSVLQIESADGSIARTVIENTSTKDQQILTMNSLQSVTALDVYDGASYLAIMSENLDTLRAALEAQ